MHTWISGYQFHFFEGLHARTLCLSKQLLYFGNRSRITAGENHSALVITSRLHSRKTDQGHTVLPLGFVMFWMSFRMLAYAFSILYYSFIIIIIINTYSYCYPCSFFILINRSLSHILFVFWKGYWAHLEKCHILPGMTKQIHWCVCHAAIRPSIFQPKQFKTTSCNTMRSKIAK